MKELQQLFKLIDQYNKKEKDKKMNIMNKRNRSDDYVRLKDIKSGARSFHINYDRARKQAKKWAGETGEHDFLITEKVRLCPHCSSRVVDGVCGSHGSVISTRKVELNHTIKIIDGDYVEQIKRCVQKNKQLEIDALIKEIKKENKK